VRRGPAGCLRGALALLGLAAFASSLNLHLGLLQSAGWFTMAIGYSVESGSVSEGISRTFSGEEPCSACRQVEAAIEAHISGGPVSMPREEGVRPWLLPPGRPEALVLVPPVADGRMVSIESALPQGPTTEPDLPPPRV